ncbi:PREDICTED: uncharacterized protein LOC107093134 [Cyprinodon variegatus]|uniref:Uncharacterized LOC107093134 n=1 Tax=Cyprinodon variegatus TaxID=28743 RepID=A0A3Q2CM38_CYPVA|nr:PREDICTED: uncharacterized protein LOC107093134 [Cyprinodon variegatus]XP_015243465.1 PREDICTED: uncharacterized protein LOC107093134 [Cyprinodon variegatus]XP_015243466.1 PREDICTED: uncharacterized protein LOC107093134 [Cyprinodon variegatus]
MADLQSKQQDVQKQTVNQKHPRSSKKLKRNFCMLCRKSYLKREGQDHMHSMQHHTELEAALGKDALHSCQACQINSLSLNEYADHILTSQHQKRFQKLKKSNAKPVPLCKSLNPVTIKSILTRNKELKKEEKKAMRKNKKKQKQSAGEKRANKQHPGVQNRNIDPKTKMLYKSKQLQAGAPNQWAQTPRPGNDHGVILNKENKIYRNPPPPPYRPFLDQQWNPPYQPRGPVGQPHPYHYGRQQHIHGCYGYNQQHQMKAKRFQMGSYNSQSASANLKQAMPAISQSNSNQKNPALDGYFTGDQPPQSGAISFDHNQAEKVNQAPPNHRETDPNQPGSTNSSAPGDSENKSSSPAPIQDVDISAMLKQIRRALGVREPCRADREARRQTENVQTEHRDTEKQDNAEQSAATPANTDALASNCAPPADAGVSFSTIPPLKGKLSTFKATQETNQTKSQKLKDRPKNDDKRKSLEASNSLPSVSGCTVEHNPLLNKQLHIPGVPNKLSWTEMYDNMKRKTLKGRPRFGIQLGVQPTDTGGPAQDSDLPLSEGFHWESIPGSPSVMPPVLPSSHADHLSEAQTDSQTQNSRGQPDVAQPGCSSKTAMQISMKVEPNLEGENEDLSSNSNANKRPRSMLEEDDISPKQRKRKSKKDSPDQNQMDQLLAVSLKEDELSHSLQDLDKALIQARNALQAAYAEVQRLLLLKQQFTAEVNSLRAKRIEILQGMQEGYSRGNPAESASTFSPGAASTGSSTLFSPSLSHPPSAAAFIPPAYPAGLALPGVSLKQEVIHAVAAGQTSQQFLPTAEGSTSTPPLLPESSARDGLKSVKTKILDKEMEPSDFVEGTEENGRREQDQGNGPSGDKKKKKKSPHVDDEGSESDSSVEVVNPSNQEIIDIEELEYEHSTQIDAKEQPQDPQTSATADFRIASTQTSQQCETESKHKPEVHPKDNPNPPEASVEEDEPSLGTFSSHTGPVNGLQIHNGRLYTCSGDNTARAYSLVTKECEAVFGGHTNKVNCLLVSSPPNMPTRLYTGSSDQTIRCYSIKSNKCLEQISLPDRVLCLHIAWKILYVGLANGSVMSYDLKTLKELDVLECHGPRGVSCLGTSQEGARRLLLVGSYDSTISVRDAKSGLLLRTLEGHTKTVLCLKVVNDLVFSGSSDTSVHAHNIHTGELVRIYKGHSHAVTSIVILGKVMVTACLDQLVRVYELQSHDRLQVYGGHSDMVMCMAVHKSVIYTGCYDGSIQAVKLNLMKNYRCWWQGCSLIFGIAEHLFQHLVREHSNPNLQTIKCRWKECNQFFSTQQSVRQELPEHMQIHINCDSKVQP